MLDRGRDELVEREERVRAHASHVPQLLLVRLLVDLAVKELLGELEHVLVVVLGRVVARVDDGHRCREAEVDADRVQPLVTMRRGELGGELLKGEQSVVHRLHTHNEVSSAGARLRTQTTHVENADEAVERRVGEEVVSPGVEHLVRARRRDGLAVLLRLDELDPRRIREPAQLALVRRGRPCARRRPAVRAGRRVPTGRRGSVHEQPFPQVSRAASPHRRTLPATSGTRGRSRIARLGARLALGLGRRVSRLRLGVVFLNIDIVVLRLPEIGLHLAD